MHTLLQWLLWKVKLRGKNGVTPRSMGSISTPSGWPAMLRGNRGHHTYSDTCLLKSISFWGCLWGVPCPPSYLILQKQFFKCGCLTFCFVEKHWGEATWAWWEHQKCSQIYLVWKSNHSPQALVFTQIQLPQKSRQGMVLRWWRINVENGSSLNLVC